MNIRKITKYALIALLLLSLLSIVGYYIPPRNIILHGVLDEYRYGFEIITIRLSPDLILTYIPLPLIEGAILFCISTFCSLLVFFTWFFSRYNDMHTHKTTTETPVPPETIPKDMTPLQAAFYYKRRIAPKDCVALIFYWAQKGYVSIRGLPKNLNQQGELVKLIDLPVTATVAEAVLFTALFGKDSTLQWNTVGTIINNYFSKIEQSVIKEDYFNLYDYNAKKNTCVAFALCLVPLILLQIWRGNSFLMVSVPSLFLFATAGCLLYFAITRKGYSMERKFLLSTLGIACGIGALCAHLLLPFSPPVSNPWFDYYIYILSLLALPFAAALDKTSSTAMRKLSASKYFRTYISTNYPQNIPVEKQADYIYGAMPYAITLGAEDLFNEKITQEQYTTPLWYEPIWYEDKEGKGKPEVLPKSVIWDYYNYAVKDASFVRRGVLGKIKQEPGVSPFGPTGPISYGGGGQGYSEGSGSAGGGE